MREWRVPIILLSLISSLLADPISVAIGGAVALGAGTFYTFREEVKCKLYECCRPPYVEPNYQKLAEQLRDLVYGQHLVLDTLLPAIKSHLSHQASKPLVLSFHGATGSGKNHVARIVANSLFQKGMKSEFVHHIIATAEFSDRSRMHEYQVKLQQRLLTSVAACGRSLFIFDEVDKLPEQLLASIKPFLDYHDSIRGVDFRSSIFIFLSNAGGDAIAQQTLSHRLSGLPRTKLKVGTLERIGKVDWPWSVLVGAWRLVCRYAIRTLPCQPSRLFCGLGMPVSEHVYNTAGGLKLSELISNHLIDHFIPFLPLERDHVRSCIIYYLEHEKKAGSGKDEELVEEILSSLQFFPADDPVFSSSGCKRVEQKADVAFYNRRDRYASQDKRIEGAAGHDPHDEI